MKLFTFIDEYCSDLIQNARRTCELIDLGTFPHDDIITGEDGVQVPVIYVNGVTIPITDIFNNERPDFALAYPSPECLEAYDNYLSNVTLLEGPDAIMRVRKSIEASLNKLNDDLETFDRLGDLI